MLHWRESSVLYGRCWMSGRDASWRPTRRSAWVMGEFRSFTGLVAFRGKGVGKGFTKSKQETALWRVTFVGRVRDESTLRFPIRVCFARWSIRLRVKRSVILNLPCAGFVKARGPLP